MSASKSLANNEYTSKTLTSALETTLVFNPSSDCPEVGIVITAVSSLVGMNFAAEAQFVNGGAWYVVGMVPSNSVATTVPIVVSGVIAAVPAYIWRVKTLGAIAIRVKLSALTSGTCTARIVPTA